MIRFVQLFSPTYDPVAGHVERITLVLPRRGDITGFSRIAIAHSQIRGSLIYDSTEQDFYTFDAKVSQLATYGDAHRSNPQALPLVRLNVTNWKAHPRQPDKAMPILPRFCKEADVIK